ncbi:MAG: FprA family A-type flavoprotein [Phycisphaerae bacterium]
MKDIFQAQKVTDRIYWVGAIDWSVRDFHGYLTSRGTTYNAFLILADKITLVDTVKAPFKDELLARVASVVNPEKIDYIISNHAEPDHSGCLAAVIEATEPEKVFTSKNGVKALEAHFRIGDKLTAVEEGESIDLGGRTVTFAETRMCHWPDSMVSYVHEDKLLFSQDAFGMHLASYERFADQIEQWILDEEAAKYYANILLPLSNFVAKSVEKLASLELPIDYICPDHGPIWREEPLKMVQQYADWANQNRTNKAVVLYDTMWNSTELMARAVGEGLASGGTHTVLMSLKGAHRSDVATQILDAGALVVGAPTINKEMFPTLADCMTYLKGLKPAGMIGGTFGSYGWGGEAPKDLAAMLDEMNIEQIGEPVRINYVPDSDSLAAARKLGQDISSELAKRTA